MDTGINMSFEAWKRENEAQGVVAEPSGFENWKKQNVEMGYTPSEPSDEAVDMAYGKYVESMKPHVGPGVQIGTREFFKKTGQAQKWIASGLVKTPRSHFQKIGEATKRGKESFITNQKYFEAVMLGKGDPEMHFKDWKKQRASDQLDPIEGSFMAEMQYGTARILPGMIEGAKQSIPHMATGAAVGFMAVPGPDPADVVTVPVGIGVGFKVGSTYAWYRQGAGEMLLNMRDEGFDEGASKAVASIAAIPYALIEQIQIKQLTPGLRKGADKVIQKSVTKLMGQVAKKYGKTLAAEDLEEVAQEGVMIIAEDLSKYFSGQGVSVSKAELQERAFRLWNTAKESAKAMALLPLPGAVVDMHTGSKAMEALPAKRPAAKPQVPEPARKKEERELLEGTPYGKVNIPGLTAKIFTVSNIADTLTAKTKVKVKGRKQKMKTLSDDHAAIIAGYEEVSDVIDANPEALSELVAIKNLLPAYTEAIESFKQKPTRETRNTIQAITDQIGELRGAYADKLAGIKEAARAVKAAEQIDLEVPETIEQLLPETPDQAIGKQYGLEPTETQTRLDDAELRYRELKNKPTVKRSKIENKELAFLRRNRTNIEAILERETSPIENKMPKKKVLELGHRIPELLGMSELERRDFNREITGQISMKDMTPAQRQQVVTALAKTAKERGIDMKEELKTSPVGELVVKLEERKQKPVLTRRDKRNLTKLRKVLHSLQSGTGFYFLHASRIKRVCRALDNYEDNGPFTKYIYQPVKTGDTTASVNFSKVMKVAIETFNDADIDVVAMMTEVNDIGIKAKLTTAERVGVYALAQNEGTMNHLLSEFSKDEIVKVIKSVKESKDEMYVADSIKAYFEHGWPMFQQIARASGVASGTVKEKNYITAFVTDKNDLNQTDFMEGLIQQFAEGKKVPGQQLTIKRKRGAKRNIELNIFTIHARAARSIERFKVMAPVAKKVGSLLGNRKVKLALNNATYGHGVQTFDKWLQDSIRGSAAYDTSVISKSLRVLRMFGINYVLGYKVLTAAKQGISFFTAASIHPGMVPLLMANITNNAMPGKFREMETFVESKSDLVKTRDWNRDLRTAWDSKAVKKLYAGKKLSPISMRMATAVDHYTVVTVWKSAYQLAQKQNMNEEESVQFADGVIERTQPMGKAVDLPNFFRGNELERNLTIFQNQVNQNGNMLWYDILGERKAKKISNSMMGYRILMSQVAPALLLGMISRGRPPEDIKEAAKDMFMYLVSPFTFLGPWIYNIVAGDYGPRRMIAETPLVETAKLGAAIRSGDPGKIVKHGARATGAWSGGKIPLQAIATAEGAWRLANDETDDFRELVWSQYALKSKKKKKTGGFTY